MLTVYVEGWIFICFVIVMPRDLSLLSLSSSRVKLRQGVIFLKEFGTASLSV